jgi:FkbM family methyltransferase
MTSARWNLVRTARATARDIRLAWSIADDLGSRLRLGLDVVLYRVLRLTYLPGKGRERTIRCLGGARVTYRLNRGDIETIRHVLFDEVYRLPFDLATGSVVDLGANIGLTSLWLHRRYGFQRAIAVEPSTANARLAIRNLDENRVPATVIRAAVAGREGEAVFVPGREPNLGRTDDRSEESESYERVEAITMSSILDEIGGSVSLVKVDIEGAESELLSDPSWLDYVQAVIVEFHPDVVDYPALAQLIESRGFRFFPVGSVHEHTTDAFLRIR